MRNHRLLPGLKNRKASVIAYLKMHDHSDVTDEFSFLQRNVLVIGNKRHLSAVLVILVHLDLDPVLFRCNGGINRLVNRAALEGAVVQIREIAGVTAVCIFLQNSRISKCHE